MVFITIVTGAYKPTYILGASHCIYIIGLSLSFLVLIHISIIIVPNVIGMFIFIAIVNIVGVVMHNG